jgi:hypothetical protein
MTPTEVDWTSKQKSVLPKTTFEAQELYRIAGKKTIASLSNPSVLLSKSAMDELRTEINRGGSEMRALLPDAVRAIRHSMLAGMKNIFRISAIMMLIAFVIICTVPATTASKDP